MARIEWSSNFVATGGGALKHFVAVAAMVAAWTAVAWAPPALAFHDLDCGPFRAATIDKKTGARKCVQTSPDAQKQFLRFRKLRQEQEQRTNDLLLQQRQRQKAQDLIAKQELNKQKQFQRQSSQKQQQSVLNRQQALKRQQGLKRLEPASARRRELLRESELERAVKLLEQQVELPGAGLLDDQKSFRRRLEKDQKGQ